MSIRALGTRLFKHGTSVIRHIRKRNLNTTIIADKINVAQQVAPQPQALKNNLAPRGFGLRTVGVQIGLQARKILIDNVLNRVTNSLAADLRKRAARRILYGDSGPFFALVGVSLASGTGLLTKEDELEGVCWEIREAISKIKWHYHDVDIDESRFENTPITLNDLSFGKPIAKGSNAVVYATRIQTPDEQHKASAEMTNTKIQPEPTDDITRFPLALKMMFNYDIQSSAMAILKAMYRETVPARLYYSNVGISDWEIELSQRNRHLPPHPNVIAIFSVFTDYVPELEDCRGLYPAALPRRIYSEGEGRNMSLFLLMKRYNTNLKDYVTSSVLSKRTSILLFAQLLEGVAHLTAHDIAHRDLKSDNLLLDTSEVDTPILVISDFGCCLADKQNGLMLPYTSYDVDKGGNTALMAPEILGQQPGTFSVLNYSKSDLWAAGAIAYEIFGCVNPFYGDKNQEKLRSINYKEDELPELPDHVPTIINILVKNCLKRNPSKRLHPEIAANVCQLFLWAPSTWLKPGNIKLPTSAEILQWLLSLTTKILCEGRINNKTFSQSSDNIIPGAETGKAEGTVQKVGRRTYPEYLLISSFLCRAKLSNIRAALSWIQSISYEV
ncbi:serine/threonine-protein kinase PINK1, mitochondrial [Anoplophora glabripennis]|uniref:serine/threonine-protein kinase PINK1, mitochondrial n=1 Tax=Anoplophora glabripennis TaxID=217634 RepID=UPI000873BD86|nr:serine/threonine-protein kinase PINK1, mitochondrial [Anoplophora glabripennis]